MSARLRPHGSPDDASGSRERAPDDRLRVVLRRRAFLFCTVRDGIATARPARVPAAPHHEGFGSQRLPCAVQSHEKPKKNPPPGFPEGGSCFVRTLDDRPYLWNIGAFGGS